ncbi:MAG: AAA family ATPase [Brevinematia bacterium]
MPVFLKKLELFGFKSFADRSKIEFNSPITAIVGPNGSGKSNLVDAIRWVLGENSIKTLRCGTFEDVIFSGSQYRSSLSVAEVSLLFDNSSRILQVPLDEIEITKRYYRSGESKILINKQETRVKDIISMFLGTGFSKEGYSIVGQGEVDNLIIGNPQDRRNYIDELLGISKIKFKKKEAEKRLQDININLSTLSIKFESIEKDYLRLKNELQKLIEYQETSKEIESLEKLHAVILLKEHKNELEKLFKQKEKILENLKEISKEIDTLSIKLENLDLLIQNESIILSQKREELNNVEKTLKNKELEKKSLESKIELSKKANEIHIESIKKELKRKEELEKEKSNLSNMIEKYSKEYSTTVTSLKELQQYAQKLIEEKEKLQKEKLEMLSDIEKIKETLRKAENLEIELNWNYSQKDLLKNSKNEIISLLSNIEKSMKEIENDTNTIETEINKLKKDKETISISIKETSQKIANLETQANEIESIVKDMLAQSQKAFKEFSENVSKSALKIGEFIKKIHTTSKEIINICNIIENQNPKSEELKDKLNQIKVLSTSINEDIERLPFLANITEFISIKNKTDEKINQLKENINNILNIMSEEKEKLILLKEKQKEMEITISIKENELLKYRKQMETTLKEIQNNQHKLETIQQELEKLDTNILNISLELQKISKDYGIDTDTNQPQYEENEKITVINNLKTFLENKIKSIPLEEIDRKIKEKEKTILYKQNEILQLEKQTTITKLNIESLEERISKIDEEIKKIQEFLLSKNTEISKEEENINKTKEIIEKLSKEIQEIVSKKDQLLTLISDKSFIIKESNQTYRNILNQKNELSKKLNLTEKEMFSVEEKIAVIKNKVENLNQKMIENYNITLDEIATNFDENIENLNIEEIQNQIHKLKDKLRKIGSVNENAEEEYKKVENEYINLKSNIEDIMQSKQKLEEMISNINKEIEKTIKESLNDISRTITEVFKEVFNGGNVEIKIDNNDLIEGDIELKVNIPGKKIRNLSLLSGGEKALVGIIFIFSALMINNTPVVIMDEVDAPLDDENTERFKKLILAFKDKTQFIIISHNKSTIEICQDIYGITMEEKGVSKVVSYKLQEIVS